MQKKIISPMVSPSHPRIATKKILKNPSDARNAAAIVTNGHSKIMSPNITKYPPDLSVSAVSVEINCINSIIFYQLKSDFRESFRYDFSSKNFSP